MLESRCQGEVEGTEKGVIILIRLKKEFYSDERDLREHLKRRARQAILGEISAQMKTNSTEYNIEIQNMERRNSEYA